MPQMMPMNWLILFALFCLLLMMFSLINYFSIMKNPVMKSSSNFKSNNLFWKW